jgi:hypothetical protein
MTLEEKIISHVRELPETKKAEVLEFLKYLQKGTDGKDWSAFSFSLAMEGMEDENSPYSIDDIKESFL